MDDTTPAHARRVLTREWLPVDGGEVGLAVLLAAIAIHVWIAALGPDRDGFLFRNGVLVEAVGQSFLLLAPPLSLYLAVRAVRRNRERLSPYLTLVAGGFLTVITVAAVLVAVFG